MKKIYLVLITLLFVLAVPSVTALTEKIVAYYPMTSNCTLDTSSNGYHGTNYGVSWKNDSHGCEFQQSFGDYITIDDTLGSWIGVGGSLSVWTQLKSWASYRQLLCFTKAASVVGLGESGGNDFMARAYDGAINEVDSLVTYNTNTNWNHLTMSWNSDGDITGFYINNVSQGTSTAGSVSVSDMLHMTIGASFYGGSASAYYDGMVMGVGIYNGTLSTDDISTLYGEGRTYDPFASAPADSCTCPSINTNWEIDATDYCGIVATCDIGTGNITIINAGEVSFNAAITAANILNIETGSTLWINNSANVIITG